MSKFSTGKVYRNIAKVKFTPEQATKAQRERERERESSGIAFFNLSARWSTPRPGRFIPVKRVRYPWYMRLGGPQGPTDGCGKSGPPPGFDPRIVQPVASRYNDYVTAAHTGIQLKVQSINYQMMT